MTYEYEYHNTDVSSFIFPTPEWNSRLNSYLSNDLSTSAATQAGSVSLQMTRSDALTGKFGNKNIRNLYGVIVKVYGAQIQIVLADALKRVYIKKMCFMYRCAIKISN